MASDPSLFSSALLEVSSPAQPGLGQGSSGAPPACSSGPAQPAAPATSDAVPISGTGGVASDPGSAPSATVQGSSGPSYGTADGSEYGPGPASSSAEASSTSSGKAPSSAGSPAALTANSLAVLSLILSHRAWDILLQPDGSVPTAKKLVIVRIAFCLYQTVALLEHYSASGVCRETQ